MRYLRIVVLLAGLFSGLSAVSLQSAAAGQPHQNNEFGPTLWQNLRVGMTPSQVQSAQPTATPPAEPSTLKGGAICLLEIRSVTVLGDNYQACFFFEDGTLAQVTLHALGIPYESQFRGIVTVLRAKYGKELSLDSNVMGFDANWMTPDGVNVSVVFWNQYGNLLNINYQVRLKREESGL
jgi:hypothetical protein